MKGEDDWPLRFAYQGCPRECGLCDDDGDEDED